MEGPRPRQVAAEAAVSQSEDCAAPTRRVCGGGDQRPDGSVGIVQDIGRYNDISADISEIGV